MSNKDLVNIGENIIKFKSDKPFRMFVGEINEDNVKKISPGEVEGFKNGDKVGLMHAEDFLWFLNELTNATKRKQ